MSLFDDNFIISMEAKAKAAKEEEEEGKEPEAEGECNCGKEDCPKCNPKAEGEGEEKDDDKKEEPKEECKEGEDAAEPEEGEEQDPEEAAETEAAVDADINADSIEEATGFDKLIASDKEDAHYACLEAVTALVAFDEADLVCTEAYKAATSQYEKQMVTESFKDKVKAFGARFKAFLVKIKNAIVRIFNKAVNYIKIFTSKVSAKFASKVKLDKSQKVDESVTIRIAEALEKDFASVVTKVMMPQKDPFYEIAGVIKNLAGSNYLRAKEDLNAIEVPKKQDLVNNVMKQGYRDVKLASMQGDGDKYLNDLKSISKNVDIIKGWRKQMEQTLKSAEAAAKAGKDISTEKINVLTAALNKAMSCFNSRVSAMVSLQSVWVNQRVKIVRALAKYQGKEMPKSEEKEENVIVPESANPFADFLSMIH